jgi:hypothetical protein
MQDLIDKITAATGLGHDSAANGAGIVLNLLRTQGAADKVSALFAEMPGAAELAAQANSGGGLMAKMAGGMMGGPLAAITRLQAAGISSDQQKLLIAGVIDYAKAKGGAKLVRAAASNVPGLSGYL